MRETLRCGSAQNENPDQIRTTFFCKRIFQRANIQRGWIELVGKVRVLLVVGLALDVDFVEKVEGRSDTSNREAQLKYNEKEQRDQEDRNEREGNFSYVGHGGSSSERRDDDRIPKHSVVKRHPVVRLRRRVDYPVRIEAACS